MKRLLFTILIFLFAIPPCYAQKQIDKHTTLHNGVGNQKILEIGRNINYFDKNTKKYKKRDNNLVESVISEKTHFAKNDFYTQMGYRADSTHTVKFYNDIVSWKFKGAASVKGKVKDNKVTYKDAWNGIDVEQLIYPEGIKETYIIKDNTANSSIIMSLKSNLDIVYDKGQLKYGSQFTTPVPTAIDANGNEVELLTEFDGKEYLIYFNKDTISFPLIIDPTITIDSTDADTGKYWDCSIRTVYLNTNAGKQAGYAMIQHSLEHSAVLYWVDPSGIPSTATIDSAVLILTRQAGSLTVNDTMCNSRRALIEGRGVGDDVIAGEPTWNSYAHANAWTIAGGRSTTTDIYGTNIDVTSINHSDALWYIQFGNCASQWCGGGAAYANNGMRLSSGALTEDIYAETKETVDHTARPRAFIYYTEGPVITGKRFRALNGVNNQYRAINGVKQLR